MPFEEQDTRERSVPNVRTTDDRLRELDALMRELQYPDEGTYSVLKKAILGEQSINHRNNVGNSLVMICAQNPGHDALKLIEYSCAELGADTNLINVQGYTALHYMLSNMHKEAAANRTQHLDIDTKIISLLLHYGANPNLGSDILSSPLHFAAYFENFYALNSFVHANRVHGRESETRDANGRTPLHFAASAGHERAVGLLIDTGGANKDAESNNGYTAISFALKHKKLATFNTLVNDHGAVVRDYDLNIASNIAPPKPGVTIEGEREFRATVRRLAEERGFVPILRENFGIDEKYSYDLDLGLKTQSLTQAMSLLSLSAATATQLKPPTQLERKS